MELSSRCAIIKATLQQGCSTISTTAVVQNVLVELREVLRECLKLLERFQQSSTFIRMLLAKAYKEEFRAAHKRLLRKAADLRLVWTGDGHRRGVDIQAALQRIEQIQAALLSKFKTVAAFAIVKNNVAFTEELLSKPLDAQARIISNMRGIGGWQRVRDARRHGEAGRRAKAQGRRMLRCSSCSSYIHERSLREMSRIMNRYRYSSLDCVQARDVRHLEQKIRRRDAH